MHEGHSVTIFLPLSSPTPMSSPVSFPPACPCPHSPPTVLAHTRILPTSLTPTSSPVSCTPAHPCPHSPPTLLSHTCNLPTSLPMPTSSPVSTGDLPTLALVPA